MIKLDYFLSLSEGESMSGRFLNDWKKSFEGIKIPHQKPSCLECENKLVCSNFVEKRKMNCFNCNMEKFCNSCSDLISQK